MRTRRRSQRALRGETHLRSATALRRGSTRPWPQRAGAGLGALVALGGLLTGCAASGAAPRASTARWQATSSAPCSGIDSAACMLPFPDDFDTTPATTTPNRLRVAFPAAAMPEVSTGHPLDVSDFAGNDGFSPGATILTYVPGLSVEQSRIPTQADMADSLAADAPVVLFDATSGTRWPYWAELDQSDPDRSERLLMIHPATGLAEGHRYVVALRNLRDAAGTAIPPGPLFAHVLSRTTLPPAGHTLVPGGPGSPDFEEPNSRLDAELGHLHGVVTTLAEHHVPSAGLYLAWDFTVASNANITGPELHMRDVALGSLHGTAPTFRVTQVTNGPFEPATYPEQIGRVARVIQGTFDVPSFLDQPGAPPGSHLRLDPKGRPSVVAGDTLHARFVCEIPISADAQPTNPASPVHPAHVALYGHSAFGLPFEVLTQSGAPAISDLGDIVFCAGDWLGISQDDVAYDGQAALDVADFPSIIARSMQAIVDFEFLGQLLTNPSGFAANPAFENAAGAPLIDPHTPLAYYGNSYGGVFGGALTAVAPNISTAILASTAMDDDVILPRSSTFALFFTLLDQTYPHKLDQQILFDLLQMLWDRAETDGYAQHLTSHPLAGSGSHRVLLGEGFGDHQVPNIATDDEARTIGAAVHQPAITPDRTPGSDPLWNLPALPDYAPSAGPALYVWDSGVPAPSTIDFPPTVGNDPHLFVPREAPFFWAQAASFIDTGQIPDPCGDAVCSAPAPPPTAEYVPAGA